MKNDTISPRRRQLLVGGLSAMPLSALASQAGGAIAASTAHGRLVVSGRITGVDGEPVSGARVEVLRGGPDATTTTDADGRFLLTTTASTRIRYRVSHAEHETRVEQMSLAPDAAGTWRGTTGVALA
jgi:protocatechuate 3,4-dioxygenase beta subunit